MGVIVQQSQITKKNGPEFGKICFFLKLEQVYHFKTKFFFYSGANLGITCVFQK